MLDKAEFGQRYINRMKVSLGRHADRYYQSIIESAEAAWEQYQEDPEDMTPEDRADDEVEEWGR